MRLDDGNAGPVLADTWERWAQRCASLSPAEWSTPTRCQPWDVRALVAHACPDPAMFDLFEGSRIDGPAAVQDAAQMLRRFNEPGGVAHTMANDLAESALADAAELAPEAVVARFTESADRVRVAPVSRDNVLAYPVVGSATLAVVAEVALMEATVHLLDLADAVGGVEPSATAIAAARDLLIAVPDPQAAVEVLAGRRPPGAALPAIR